MNKRLTEPSWLSAHRFLVLRARPERRIPARRKPRQPARPTPMPSPRLLAKIGERTAAIMASVDRAGRALVDALLAIRTAPVDALVPRPAIPQLPIETNADRLRRYRSEAAAAGRCYTCRCRPAKPGARSCLECFERVRQREDSLAYVKCANCGKPETRTLICSECQSRRGQRISTLRREALAAGNCGSCRVRPVRQGTTMCLSCHESNRRRSRATYHRRRSGRSA